MVGDSPGAKIASALMQSSSGTTIGEQRLCRRISGWVSLHSCMSALSRGASRSLYCFFPNVQYTRDNGAKVHGLQTDAACMLSPKALWRLGLDDTALASTQTRPKCSAALARRHGTHRGVMMRDLPVTVSLAPHIGEARLDRGAGARIAQLKGIHA